MELNGIKVSRSPRANECYIFTSSVSKPYFVISSERVDRNIFNFSSFTKRHLKADNRLHLFGKRKEKELSDLLIEDSDISAIMINLLDICRKPIESGAAIYLVQNKGNFRVTVPNREWWDHMDFSQELKRFKDYLHSLANGASNPKRYNKAEVATP